MTVAVASEKSVTGNTSVAVNIAFSVDNLQLVGCNVEEHPEINKGPCLRINTKIDGVLCDVCGECTKFCQVNAVSVSLKKDEPLSSFGSKN